MENTGYSERGSIGPQRPEERDEQNKSSYVPAQSAKKLSDTLKLSRMPTPFSKTS